MREQFPDIGLQAIVVDPECAQWQVEGQEIVEPDIVTSPLDTGQLSYENAKRAAEFEAHLHPYQQAAVNTLTAERDSIHRKKSTTLVTNPEYPRSEYYRTTTNMLLNVWRWQTFIVICSK